MTSKRDGFSVSNMTNNNTIQYKQSNSQMNKHYKYLEHYIYFLWTTRMSNDKI